MRTRSKKSHVQDKNCDDGSGQDNEMDWPNQSGEAYWDIGIDGMSESVRMEKWIKNVDKPVHLVQRRKKKNKSTKKS